MRCIHPSIIYLLSSVSYLLILPSITNSEYLHTCFHQKWRNNLPISSPEFLTTLLAFRGCFQVVIMMKYLSFPFYRRIIVQARIRIKDQVVEKNNQLMSAECNYFFSYDNNNYNNDNKFSCCCWNDRILPLFCSCQTVLFSSRDLLAGGVKYEKVTSWIKKSWLWRDSCSEENA